MLRFHFQSLLYKDRKEERWWNKDRRRESCWEWRSIVLDVWKAGGGFHLDGLQSLCFPFISLRNWLWREGGKLVPIMLSKCLGPLAPDSRVCLNTYFPSGWHRRWAFMLRFKPRITVVSSQVNMRNDRPECITSSITPIHQRAWNLYRNTTQQFRLSCLILISISLSAINDR